MPQERRVGSFVHMPQTERVMPRSRGAYMAHTERGVSGPLDRYARVLAGLPAEQVPFAEQLLTYRKIPLYVEGSAVVPTLNERLREEGMGEHVATVGGLFKIKKDDPRARFGADKSRVRRSA